MRHHLIALLALSIAATAPAYAQKCATKEYYTSIVPGLERQAYDRQAEVSDVEEQIQNWRAQDPFRNNQSVQLLLRALNTKRDMLANDVAEIWRARDNYVLDGRRCYGIF